MTGYINYIGINIDTGNFDAVYFKQDKRLPETYTVTIEYKDETRLEFKIYSKVIFDKVKQELLDFSNTVNMIDNSTIKI